MDVGWLDDHHGRVRDPLDKLDIFRPPTQPPGGKGIFVKDRED